jgi:hypothetical protein
MSFSSLSILHHLSVESKRERTKKLSCLSIQEKETSRLIYREKTILGFAEYHNRSPKPSTSAGARPPPRHGGRRGPWGLQATGPNLMPKTQADPNLYIRGDGILILLYVEDISMTYPEATTKAVIEVKAKLSEKYKITILGPARQFLGIGIHRDDIVIGISLGQKVFINTIFKRFGMDYAHSAMTPMDPNVNLDLVEDRREKELEDIKEYQEIVGSLMYTAHETRPEISFALAALCQYNSLPFTSHMTATK